MTVHTEDAAMQGELLEPITSEGRDLLHLIETHRPAIAEAAPDNDRRGSFPHDVFEGLRKDGVLGATVPSALGGLGVERMHDVSLALLRVAEADASTALALHMQLSRALTLTYEWRTGPAHARALAERLLRGMGSGEAVVSTGVKDIPRDRRPTTLTPADDGGWLLSGGKTLVSMAPMATDFAVYAQTRVPGQRPQSGMAVLTRDTPGLTVMDNWDGLGMRASGSVDIVFEDCRIAPEDVVLRGPAGEQNLAMLAGQTVSSITMLGIYTGIAQSAREIAVSTLLRRGAAGAAAARTLVAEMDARLFTMRSTVAAALARADRLSYDDSGDPQERGPAMMTPFQCAKMVVNQLAPAIVFDAQTLIGGASFSAAHPLARLYRDVRAGGFMQPYTFVDAVDYLSAQALGPVRNG
ncbi:acyl-CoA dehydrogenase family protein [Streptosporangium sp. NPDC002524]|uniref:acyl-CoA dehydrogenase family protein n=1 Tax=Streptosporangium sp. NPDC002524 TaxID=3154537 RepID=UPI0033189E14